MVYKRLLAVAGERKRVLDPAKYTSRVSREQTQIQAFIGTTSAGSTAPTSLNTTAPPSTSVPPSTSAAEPSHESSKAKAKTSQRARPLSYATFVYDIEAAGPRPQEIRAYNLWHHKQMALDDICAALRSKENPLAQGTVMCVWRFLSWCPSSSHAEF